MISDLQKPINSGFNSKTEALDVVKDIDLSKKIAIVTGGYSGIGLDTTKSLAAKGAIVIIPAKRPDLALRNLEGIIPKKNILSMNLADLNSVKNFCNTFKNEHNKLDILINNAGIMACPETRIGDEWESQFAINHIGHFVLTKSLMNHLAESNDGRLVSLSSSAHSISQIRWDDIHFNKNSYDKWLAYGQSKTAASLLAIEFNRLMQNTGASGFAVHPGGIFTPLQRHLKKEEMIALGWIDKDGGPSELASNFFKTTSQGASTSLWCATNPDLKDIGGVFCEDCNIAYRKSDIDKSMQRYFGVADWAIDSEEAQKLWQITEKMLEHL